MSIQKIIENPHPIYKNNHTYWDFLLNSYEGGQDYIGMNYHYSHEIYAGGRELKRDRNQHMFQFKKERNEDYKNRVKMSYYYNFCSPIIDIYTNHLFKKPILQNWDGIETTMEYRQENLDRMNNGVGEFRKEIADRMQIMGLMYVMIDQPKSDRLDLSVQDQIDNDLFPYAVLRNPQDVINWSLDRFGRPYWVLVREQLDGNTDPFHFDPDKRTITQYRLWDRQNWILVDEKGNRIDEGNHGLGEVPITAFYNKRSKKEPNFLGISALADIAYIARDVYNACSELRQILREQTFALLVLQGEASDYDETEVGVSRGVLYPKETNTPMFISPDSGNAQNYYEHIDRQISAMFRLAKLEGASAKFQGSQGVQQSGISKAYDFNETNQALAEKAMNMEDGEAKMWELFAKWQGTSFDGYVNYPDDFSVQSLNEDLEEAEKAMKLQIGTEFNKEIKKAIIQKKFQRLSEEEVQRIIDNMETSEGVTTGGRLVDRLSRTSTQRA